MTEQHPDDVPLEPELEDEPEDLRCPECGAEDGSCPACSTDDYLG